jgi:hypothetical protein
VALAATFVAAGFETVWARLADPAGLAELFPGWLASIAPDDDHFTARGAAGERFDVYPRLNRDEGAADFELVDELGNAELERCRVFPVKTGGCVVLRLSVRWRGIDDASWERQRAALADDLEHARRLLEQAGS